MSQSPRPAAPRRPRPPPPTYTHTHTRRRAQVFEGIPPPYDTMKRVVVPAALRVSHLKPGRDFAHLGKLAAEVGWKHLDLIKRLEAKRLTNSEAFHAKAKEARRRLATAQKKVDARA